MSAEDLFTRPFYHTSTPGEEFFNQHHYKGYICSLHIYAPWRSYRSKVEDNFSILQDLYQSDRRPSLSSPYGRFVYYCGDCGEVSSPKLSLTLDDHFNSLQVDSVTCSKCGTVRNFSQIGVTQGATYIPNYNPDCVDFGEPYRVKEMLYLPMKLRGASLTKFRRKDYHQHYLCTFDLDRMNGEVLIKGPFRRSVDSKKPIDWDAAPRTYNCFHWESVAGACLPDLSFKMFQLAEEYFQKKFPGQKLSSPEEYKNLPYIQEVLDYFKNPFLPKPLVVILDYMEYFHRHKINTRPLDSFRTVKDVFEFLNIPKSKLIRRTILENPDRLSAYLWIKRFVKKPDNVAKLLRAHDLGFKFSIISSNGRTPSYLDLWIKEKGETFVVAKLLAEIPQDSEEYDLEVRKTLGAGQLNLLSDIETLFLCIRHQFPDYAPPFNGSLESIHDKMVAKYHGARATNLTFHYPQEVLELQKKEEDFEIVLPPDGKTLKKLGLLLDNCAGTYAGKVSINHCWVFEVRSQKKPIALIEVSHAKKIVQAKGLSNTLPPEDTKQKILQWAKEMDLTVQTRDLAV